MELTAMDGAVDTRSFTLPQGGADEEAVRAATVGSVIEVAAKLGSAVGRERFERARSAADEAVEAAAGLFAGKAGLGTAEQVIAFGLLAGHATATMYGAIQAANMQAEAEMALGESEGDTP